MAMRDKSYISSKPNLPPLEQNGWESSPEAGYLPIKCLEKPAPRAVLELVKCGCRGACESVHCSCLKNGLLCTALCKCQDCSNMGETRDLVHVSDNEDSSDEDNDEES